LGEDRAYNFDPNVIVTRVPKNLSYFYVNYLGLSIVLFILSVVMKPGAIIGVGFLGALWFAFLTKVPMLSNGNIYVPAPVNQEVPQKAIIAVFCGVTAAVLKWLLADTFWYVIYTTIVLTVVHSVLRNTHGLNNNATGGAGATGYYQSVPVPGAGAPQQQQQPPEIQAQI